jgi:Tol biopolymer transport system component
MNILARLGFGLLALAPLMSSAADSNTRYFDHPQKVTIQGYDGHAMEPFMSRDGRYLLFNDLNEPGVDTKLHYAERLDDLHFQYRGELSGVNTPALEGVPSLDRKDRLYFVSPRNYEQTLTTIYRGRFSHGRVTEVAAVAGVSRKQPGWVNFDAEISPDGRTLYFVDAQFGKHGPESADLVMATRQGDDFQRLADSGRLLEKINSAQLEYAPCISSDGLLLLFTRARADFKGGTAIYMARRKSLAEPFDAPQRLAALDGIVEAATLTPDEQAIYVHRKEGRRHVLYLLRH